MSYTAMERTKEENRRLQTDNYNLRLKLADLTKQLNMAKTEIKKKDNQISHLINDMETIKDHEANQGRLLDELIEKYDELKEGKLLISDQINRLDDCDEIKHDEHRFTDLISMLLLIVIELKEKENEEINNKRIEMNNEIDLKNEKINGLIETEIRLKKRVHMLEENMDRLNSEMRVVKKLKRSRVQKSDNIVKKLTRKCQELKSKTEIINKRIHYKTHLSHDIETNDQQEMIDQLVDLMANLTLSEELSIPEKRKI